MGRRHRNHAPDPRTSEAVPRWRRAIRANIAMFVENLRDDGLEPAAIREKLTAVVRQALGPEPSDSDLFVHDRNNPGSMTLPGAFRTILDESDLNRSDAMVAESFWAEINAGLDRYL